MINNNALSKNPAGTYCCKEGRPIRAKKMRKVFINLGLTKITGNMISSKKLMGKKINCKNQPDL